MYKASEMEERAAKDLKVGEEKIEKTFFGSFKKLWDYTYRHMDGTLFHTVMTSVEACRAARDKWLEELKAEYARIAAEAFTKEEIEREAREEQEASDKMLATGGYYCNLHKCIDTNNGNGPWKDAEELTDEEVDAVLEAIGQLNALTGTGTLETNEENKVFEAIKYAEKGQFESRFFDQKRVYIARWTHIYGNFIIG